jgi:hypothetical protein
MPDSVLLFGIVVAIHFVIAAALSAASTEVVVFTETVNSDQKRQTSMHLLRWLDNCDFVCSRLLPHQLGPDHLDSRSERDTEVSG